MKTNNKIMESLEDFRTRLMEIEVLRQEVADLLEEVFPDVSNNHVVRAMSYYRAGIEDILYHALTSCAFTYAHEDRNIHVFLDDLADDVLDGKEFK